MDCILYFLFQYRTIATHRCLRTPDEMDISESTRRDQLEISSSGFTDSSSCTEEELSVFEIVIIGFITLLKGCVFKVFLIYIFHVIF